MISIQKLNHLVLGTAKAADLLECFLISNVNLKIFDKNCANVLMEVKSCSTKSRSSKDTKGSRSKTVCGLF